MSFPNTDSMFTAIGNTSPDKLNNMVFMDENNTKKLGIDISNSLTTSDAGKVEIISYAYDKVELNVYAQSPTILVVINSYSRFWQACVNAKKAPYLPAFHAFSGIPTAQGHHKVILEYIPPYAKWRNPSC